AVGNYTDSLGRTQGLALTEQSGRWSASMMPATANTHVVVRSVACVSGTSCAAAGHYLRSGHEVGYLMTLSGSALAGITAPGPANANLVPDEALGFVACRWIATCTASGSYVGAASTTVQLPLVASEEPTPAPASS
ncbi:MAG TPA: hypothetical protein VEH29_15955, partial [Acidimicrobiales bacterium]|nr:hypothetical protein [Acidimicrobiales bacterium]